MLIDIVMYHHAEYCNDECP